MDVQEIERFLPWIFQRTLDDPDNPLRGLLAAMSGLHAPAESVLSQLDRYFDSYRAPEIMLPFLAQVMNLDRYLNGVSSGAPYLLTGTQNLRNLIALVVSLSKQRGTGEGLRRFLETAVGVSGFRVEDGAQPFQIVVTIPADALPYRELVERIVVGEKPVYVTYTLAEEQPENA